MLLLLSVILIGIECVCAEITPKQKKSQYYYLEALQMKLQGQNDAAFDLLQYAYTLDPTNAAIHNELTAHYYELKLTNQAFFHLSQSAKLDTTNLWYNYSYATILKIKKQYEEGSNVLLRLIRLYPEKKELRFSLAQLYQESSEKEKAIETLNQLETMNGTPLLVVSEEKYKIYLSQNDTIKALNEIYALINSNPQNNSYYLFYLGARFQELGYYDKADSLYNAIELIDPQNESLHEARAILYYSKGEEEKAHNEMLKGLRSSAIEFEKKLEFLTKYVYQNFGALDQHPKIKDMFQVLIEMYPGQVKLHQFYSEFLIGLKEYSAAAEQQQIVVDFQKNDVNEWGKLISLFAIQGKKDQALELVKEGKKQLGENKELLYAEATIYRNNGSLEKAIELTQQVISLTDNQQPLRHSQLYSFIGEVYYELKQDSIAYHYFEKSLELNPNNSMLLNNYAYFLSLDKKELSKAETMSRRSLELEPNNPTFLDTLGWILFQQGNNTMAGLYIKKAIENGGDQEPEILEHYGDILYKDGEVKPALNYWKKAIQAGGKDEILSEKIRLAELITK